MAAATALGTAVERDDDDVGAAYQIVNDTSDGGQLLVGVFQRVGIVAEGTEPDFHSFTLDDGCLDASFQTCVLNTLLLEHTLSGDDTFLAEVVSVVISHAHEVVACIFQPASVGCGGAESIGVRPFLGTLTTVSDSTFEITDGKVGVLQDMLDVIKEVGAVVWW